nr:hypothetical protein [Tanacetum cinerariifolium]
MIFALYYNYILLINTELQGFIIELAEDELVHAIRVRVLLDTPQWLLLNGERLQVYIIGGDGTYKGVAAIYK